MIDYSKKYLKYKTKYLELKNFQSGGGAEHKFCLITGQITDQLLETLKEDINTNTYFIFACPSFNWLLWRLHKLGINKINQKDQNMMDYIINLETEKKNIEKEKEKEKDGEKKKEIEKKIDSIDENIEALKNHLDYTVELYDRQNNLNPTIKSYYSDTDTHDINYRSIVNDFLEFYRKKKDIKELNYEFDNNLPENSILLDIKAFGPEKVKLVKKFDDSSIYKLDDFSLKKISEFSIDTSFKQFYTELAYYISKYFKLKKLEGLLKSKLSNRILSDKDYEEISENFKESPIQFFYKIILELFKRKFPDIFNYDDKSLYNKYLELINNYSDKTKMKNLFENNKLDENRQIENGIKLLTSYTPYTSTPADPVFITYVLQKIINLSSDKLNGMCASETNLIPHVIDSTKFDLEKFNVASVEMSFKGKLKLYMDCEVDDLVATNMLDIYGFQQNLEIDLIVQLPHTESDRKNKLLESIKNFPFKSINFTKKIDDKQSINGDKIANVDKDQFKFFYALDRNKLGCIKKRKIFFITDLEGDMRPLISSLIELFNDPGNLIPLRILNGMNTNNGELFRDLMKKLMAEFPSNPYPYVNLLKDLKFELNIKNDWHFVFGGDVGDHGFYTLRLKKLLVDLKRSYPDNVTLLIGNRDANKIRFYQELYRANSRFQTYRQEIYQAQWTRKRKIELEGEKEDKITLLKHVLAVEMGSPNDFEYRKIELQQLLGRGVDDYLVWLSFIVESVPISKYEKLIDEDDRKLLKDLGYVIGISFEYLRNAEYIKKLDKTLVTHSNLMDNSGNPEAGDFKDEEGKEIKIQEVVKTGYINNETIREVARIVQNELNEYESNLKPLEFSNNYNTWFGSRPGGLLMASACPIAFTHRTEYENHCMNKYGKELFHWGYCRYRDSETQMPKKLDNELIKLLNEDGIKFILTGHTPQPVPIVALKHTYDIYFIGADTSYGCFDKPSNKDRRLNSGSGLVVNGDKCTVYGNLGKKLTDDNTFVNNKDDSITVKYDIKKDIGTSTEIENEKIKDIKIKDKTIFEGKKCIITGYYNENPIAMIRNDINMYPFINKKSK